MSTDAPTPTPEATPPAPAAGSTPVSETPSEPAGGAGIEGLPDVEGLPEGAREVSPLFLMLIGTAIPVALVAVAASGGSTVILILALIALVVVGLATMVFMVRITADPEHPHNASGDEQD